MIAKPGLTLSGVNEAIRFLLVAVADLAHRGRGFVFVLLA
jgi:hypothetical protein